TAGRASGWFQPGRGAPGRGCGVPGHLAPSMLGSQLPSTSGCAQAGGHRVSSPAPDQATSSQPGPKRSGHGPPGDGQPGPRRGGMIRLAVLCGVATLLLGAIVAVPAYLITRHNQARAPAQLPRVSGLPATVSTPLANLMSLSPLPRTAAPGF